MVRCYWNLHAHCWSVKIKGRVAYYAREMILKNGVFIVQESGRQRVLRTKQKQVHAFACGEPTYDFPGEGIPVTYHPYEKDHFFRRDTLEPVSHADYIRLNPNGSVEVVLTKP